MVQCQVPYEHKVTSRRCHFSGGGASGRLLRATSFLPLVWELVTCDGAGGQTARAREGGEESRTPEAGLGGGGEHQVHLVVGCVLGHDCAALLKRYVRRTRARADDGDGGRSEESLPWQL